MENTNYDAPRYSRSLLSLALLYGLSSWFFAFWWLAEAAMFIWKDYVLPYPDGNLAGEIVLLFVLIPVEAARIFFGRKGNLTEQAGPMLVSLIFSIPSAFAFIFYVVWQTFVLRAEFIIGLVALSLMGLEDILGVYALLSFARRGAYR